MGTVIGTATGTPGMKQALFLEALQAALNEAPPPNPGNDVQHYRLVSLEMEHGGIVFQTVTRVTLEFEDGPLDS